VSLDCVLTTHHNVEYVKKGRRLVERAPFRLDVPCRLATTSRADLPEAFVREGDGAKARVVLHGYDGRLWRKAVRPAASGWNFEGLLDGGRLVIGAAIDPAMKAPVRKQDAPPLEAFDDTDVRIISDDREAREAAAKAAAAKAMVVDRELWVQVREPEWLVRKADRPGESDLRLLVDIHDDWRTYIVRDNMRFRLDRLPQALAWARAARGSRAPGAVTQRSWTEIEADIVAGPWNVTRADFAFLAGDDIVAFARNHLRRTVEACAEVIEVLPERLRRRWGELRILQDNIQGNGARAAAEAGLVLVESTLAMLMEVRDISAERRALMIRQITRLRQNDRRTYLIEGLRPSAQEAEIDDADLAGLAP
jgi:hypothetical protein